MVMSLWSDEWIRQLGHAFCTCEFVYREEWPGIHLCYTVSQFLLGGDVIIVGLNLSHHSSLPWVLRDVHNVYWLPHLRNIVIDVCDFDVDFMASMKGDQSTVRGIDREPVMGGTLAVQHSSCPYDAYNIATKYVHIYTIILKGVIE